VTVTGFHTAAINSATVGTFVKGKLTTEDTAALSRFFISSVQSMMGQMTAGSWNQLIKAFREEAQR
jgi:hypothetical protein